MRAASPAPAPACGQPAVETRPLTPAPRATASTPSGAASTVSITTYPLDDSPEAAIAFTGNSHIFEAQIEGIQRARKHVNAAGSPLPFLVYVPVELSITAVYKGDLTVGDVIVMRDLGGTAEDGTTFVYSDSFRHSAWVPGASLFVFANTPTADDHSGTGITPNMVFVENNGSVRSAQDDPERMPLTEMRTRVIERWG